jgi:hypothetical protein
MAQGRHRLDGNSAAGWQQGREERGAEQRRYTLARRTDFHARERLFG